MAHSEPVYPEPPLQPPPRAGTPSGSASGTGDTWWDAYVRRLAGLPADARRVLELDCRYVVERCVLGARDPGRGGASWPEGRVRRGLIVGSVQSGKTASMLGVASMLLDRGVKILVILSGTRLALWRQTIERYLDHVDGRGEWSAFDREGRRILLPREDLIVSDDAAPMDIRRLYRASTAEVRGALRGGRPIVVLAMKQPDHLLRLGESLDSIFEATSGAEPVHLVVMDDEADDGSILDAASENPSDPATYKHTPRLIGRLWARRGPLDRTSREWLYATYIAYTATPQANILQADHNPLSPRDFCAALRVPYRTGSVEPPRQPSYRAAGGVRSYYCGGEVFYREFSGTAAPLAVARPFPSESDLASPGALEEAVQAERDRMVGDAIRAFLVAGACRLLRSDRRISTARALAGAGATVAQVKAAMPEPHTMLYHPSARVAEHFAAAEAVARWAASMPAEGDPPRDEAGGPRLDPLRLRERLDSEEALWRRWLTHYNASAEAAQRLDNAPYTAIDEARWPDLLRLLRDEIIPFVRLSIINSDEAADDRPDFELRTSEGRVQLPRDLLTIFVSGNVMSRGLTIEGLCTTLFLRSATEPAADVQMQMQRWFGYRGAHLPFCRVFLFEDQLRLFREYHENDEALRADIIGAMNRLESAPTPLVLQGEGYVATRKVAVVSELPLHPGATPFVRVVEIDDLEHLRANAAILTELLAKGSWRELSVSGALRGLVRREPLSMLEVAAALEAFRYLRHRPSASLPQYGRWASLERHLGEGAPEIPLLRLPKDGPGGEPLVSPSACPYNIAAYLRLWKAALTRRLRGLGATDNPGVPWSQLDLLSYLRDEPKFIVGVRFGEQDASNVADLPSWAKLKRMRRASTEADAGVLSSTWGSRGQSGGYLGDQLFDYHESRLSPPRSQEGSPLWRPRGHPGLLLFHVIENPRGAKEHDVVTVGLALPLGGPDHVAVLRTGSSSPRDGDGEEVPS